MELDTILGHFEKMMSSAKKWLWNRMKELEAFQDCDIEETDYFWMLNCNW
jgi:hypothetical protein